MKIKYIILLVILLVGCNYERIETENSTKVNFSLDPKTYAGTIPDADTCMNINDYNRNDYWIISELKSIDGSFFIFEKDKLFIPEGNFEIGKTYKYNWLDHCVNMFSSRHSGEFPNDKVILID